MNKIRRGNDFVFAWEIERNGLPENLSSVLEKHLYLSVFGKRVELVYGVDYDITGNVIRIEVTPTIANILGTYKAEFHYILPDNGLIDEDRKCAVDVDAFIIVGSTAQADEPSEFTVTSDMAIAFKGDKGDPLTYDDLTPEQIAELQQPATDAIASIQEVELAVETAEGLRVQAELNRQTNTSTAISNAEQATDDANDAAILANEKADLANDAAILANEKAGLAETATTQANDARDGANNAAQSATNLVNSYATDLAAKELKANKQNSLEVDGTGTKFPTVDAVNDGLGAKANQTDLAQLAGDVNLLDAVQGAKIKEIENVLSSANLGQSTQVSISGRKVVSLPKNAANGGMQVKLEGLTAENLVVNGDFRSGTTGWSGVLGTLSAANNELTYKVDALSANARVEQQIDIAIPGHKYYARGYINPKYTNTVNLSMGTPVVTVAVNMANAWNMVSAIITATSNARFRFYLNTVSWYVVGDTIKLKDIMTIDLTATFGTGNEPDRATCDKMFSDYFEGVKSFVSTGRVRSVDKNGLNPTALYLTAPELRSNGTVKDEIRKGSNGYELVKRISDIDGTVLATPVISPISYGGILNSAENGTVYHEPVIADAGVYGTNMPILLTDYPISALEEILKHENGVDTYLDVSTAVIAGDKLSFTHPSLQSGDLVLFTYAFDKESTNGNITATFYDSNVVKIDTVTGKAYRINEVVTNGILTRTLTEV